MKYVCKKCGNLVSIIIAGIIMLFAFLSGIKLGNWGIASFLIIIGLVIIVINEYFWWEVSYSKKEKVIELIKNMELKKIIKYNFWLFLLSLLVVLPYAFMNLGDWSWIWVLFMLPSFLIVALILNIDLVIKSKNLPIGTKILIVLLAPVLIVALNYATIVIIHIISIEVFGYKYFMSTRK